MKFTRATRTDHQLRDCADLHEILGPLITSGAAVFAMVYTLSTEEWKSEANRSTTRLCELMSKNYNFRVEKVYWCLSRLRDQGALKGSEANIGSEPKNQAKLLKQKPSKTCGIYGIFEGNNVYVGMSVHIESRFKTHKRQLEDHTHPYKNHFKEVEEREFKVLGEHKENKLKKKEPLYAQKLASEGYNVVNKNNFGLILEDK